jgi:hypothetical protein
MGALGKMNLICGNASLLARAKTTGQWLDLDILGSRTHCKCLAIGSHAAPLLANPCSRIIVAVCSPGAGRVVSLRGVACTQGAFPWNDFE